MKPISIFSPAVIVVALGYFVDIFDLTLFNMVRVSSLTSLGVGSEQLIDTGIMLLNCQMAGMLLGGILWGTLGDKKGRLNILFASIILYSVANLANAFVGNITQYAILRFISGLGLAGELGVGITLVSELLPKEKRGLGTTIVATIGVFGATVGGFIVEHFSWNTCYLIGGSLGLALLALRMQVHESKLFTQHKEKTPHTTSSQNIPWGQFTSLFTQKKRFYKFLQCILIGVPIWFIAGLLMAFSPELGKEIGVTEPLTAAKAISISYLGLGIGDLLSGLISQFLKSRLRAVKFFMFANIVLICGLFIFTPGKSSNLYYLFCFLIGTSAGYWAIFVTIAAEQFGTNLRATVATSVPNFVRGAVIPMTLSFKHLKTNLTIMNSMIIVGVIVFVAGFIASWLLPETFHKDLDYLETHS